MFTRSLLLAGVVASAAACGRGADAKAAQLREVEAARAKNLERRLVSPASAAGSKPLAAWALPSELREASGLALTSSEQLLTHDDEVARIYSINPKTGIISKRFTLKGTPRADFEAITVAGNDIYLLESNGRLYKFREGADGEQVAFTRYDTRLGRECEFEGVVFEQSSSSLLLPCKNVSKKSLKDKLVIYRVAVPISAGSTPEMTTIPTADIVGANGWKGFKPSDITIDPATGNYVLIAGQQKALAVITPGWKVARAADLPPGHAHADGIAISKDSILMISDEAARKPAQITLYRWIP